jgi:beta-glucanase (GH16 family)
MILSRMLLLTAAGCLAVQAQGPSWQMVWSDEFDGLANNPPDPAKWGYDLGDGAQGWGNNELETYTNSTDNVFLDGTGNLVIRALNTGTGFTSGRIKTATKFAFQYGLVVVRAKIPYAQGIWPALWMLGAIFPNVPWPDCGEIDLMENFGVGQGDASRVRAAIHGPGDTGVGIGGAYTLAGGQRFADDFHVFAVQWTPDGIAFSVDGNVYLNIASSSMPPSWQAAFSNPFFLLLNLAVGGLPVGSPDSTTPFPQQMLVDYVRVYEPSTLGNRFVPITPCRIADTRNPAGPFGGPAIAGQTSRDFLLPNSACAIPANASAFSLNVAVVPHGQLGYVTLWPAGQPQPFVATLISDGRIKSNAAIVAAGANGAIRVFAANTTDVILDINGYFLPPSAQTGLAFYPVAPCRVVDTRQPPGPLGGPALGAGSSRTFPVGTSCSLPATAQAYSFNFAAVPTGPLGFMTAWPTGQPQPLAASLNALSGTVTANAVIVPSGAGGNVDVYTTDKTDLVIDVNGYFAPPAPGGLFLYIDVPCRELDTRQPLGTPPFSGTFNVNVAAGPCGASRDPAPAAQAFVFSTTLVPPAGFGYLSMWPQDEAQPVVATLSAVDGAITSNLAIVASTNGLISIFPSDPAYLVLDMVGFFAP